MRTKGEAQTAALEEILHGMAMLSNRTERRTLRRLRQSAARLAVVAAAELTPAETEPEVARRNDDAAWQRDVRVGEIADRAPEGAAATVLHVRTIAAMSTDPKRVKTSDAELSLEQIAELLPGTGEIMQSVGNAWWRCAYAARGGNFDLAAYFARRVRSLQHKLAIVRPKYAEDLASFERDHIAPVLSACDAGDLGAFERAHARAVDAANELHVKWGKAYIRWTLPEEAPTDLDLRPDAGQDARRSKR